MVKQEFDKARPQLAESLLKEKEAQIKAEEELRAKEEAKV